MGTLSGGPFVAALDANRLPAFSFVTPDVCMDMHSCPTRTGDDWLARWVPRIVASPGYRQGSTAVFITFDEGQGPYTYECASHPTDAGCHVATVVVAPSTPAGTRSGVLFTHYSLLKTAEELLGIRPFLGHAGDAGTNSMVAAFGL
jgi:phospholipase C